MPIPASKLRYGSAISSAIMIAPPAITIIFVADVPMRIRISCCVFVLLLTAVFGIVSQSHAEKLKILTTFLPVYCFAVNVAGANAVVENLLPGNVGDIMLDPALIAPARFIESFMANKIRMPWRTVKELCLTLSIPQQHHLEQRSTPYGWT